MNERPGQAWEAVRALREWARREPAHAKWIADGAPRLTDLEYLERFGAPHAKQRRKGR